MAGVFTLGEAKVRPGSYFNIQKVSENSSAGTIDGIAAVLFKADWGPLNEAIEISVDEGYESIFGNAYTTDTIAEVFNGGAKKAIGCRIGSGGTAASITLKDSTAQDAVTITAKYVGGKSFAVSLRDKLSDDTKRECIIYAGTKEFEKVEFIKGGDEVSALVSAFSKSTNFTVQSAGSGSGFMADVTQSIFTNGTDPVATTVSYSEGLAAIEAVNWNVICVDTEDTAVHALVSSFLDRIFEVGQLTMAVLAETSSVALDTRMQNAAAFNDEKIIYVLNPTLKTSTGTLDGHLTAARIAGTIAACPANMSLTHRIIDGATELVEKITPTQIIKAETMGCLVLTTNFSNQIWIDSAINTLILLEDNQDDGWKKIRRTKTRYELITRANIQTDSLIGKVDNDVNGRATIVSQVQGIGTAMVEEGKLVSCKVTESTQYTVDGDSCWFEIDAIDKDSAERIYLTFKFRFSTQE